MDFFLNNEIYLEANGGCHYAFNALSQTESKFVNNYLLKLK